jgi:hypothetical protein
MSLLGHANTAFQSHTHKHTHTHTHLLALHRELHVPVLSVARTISEITAQTMYIAIWFIYKNKRAIFSSESCKLLPRQRRLCVPVRNKRLIQNLLIKLISNGIRNQEFTQQIEQ